MTVLAVIKVPQMRRGEQGPALLTPPILIRDHTLHTIARNYFSVETATIPCG
jgi:hypothetical protein